MLRTCIRERRPSPALVVSSLALFAALGGVGYAAATVGSEEIKDNSIKSEDIRNNTVFSRDIKNFTIAKVDLSTSLVKALTKGKTGPAGPAGPQGPAARPVPRARRAMSARPRARPAAHWPAATRTPRCRRRSRAPRSAVSG